MPKRGTEVVTVRRQATKDRYGNRVPGEVVGALRRCITYPRASTEDADRGTVSIDGLTVWAPAPLSTDLKATDDVEIDGDLYSVEGTPGAWKRAKNGRTMGLLFQTMRYGV